MGYDLQWIDGPAPGDARDGYAPLARFHASEGMMAALSREMERQRMIGDHPGTLAIGEWDARLSETGQIRGSGQVTRVELVGLLATASNDPAAPDQVDLPMEEWREQWERWLDFLVGAMNYGGFRIHRSEEP